MFHVLNFDSLIVLACLVIVIGRELGTACGIFNQVGTLWVATSNRLIHLDNVIYRISSFCKVVVYVILCRMMLVLFYTAKI